MYYVLKNRILEYNGGFKSKYKDTKKFKVYVNYILCIFAKMSSRH